MCVHFQPRNFTGCGSEGVNAQENRERKCVLAESLN